MSCALPAIAVACGIEGILQRMHKAAVDVIIYLMDSHIFVIESEVAVVGIQYIIGLEGDAEPVVEECLVELAVEVCGRLHVDVLSITGTHPLHINVQPYITGQVYGILPLYKPQRLVEIYPAARVVYGQPLFYDTGIHLGLPYTHLELGPDEGLYLLYLGEVFLGNFLFMLFYKFASLLLYNLGRCLYVPAQHINPSTCGKSKALRCEIIAETAYLPR